jgi:hypothetical protein
MMACPGQSHLVAQIQHYTGVLVARGADPTSLSSPTYVYMNIGPSKAQIFLFPNMYSVHVLLHVLLLILNSLCVVAYIYDAIGCRVADLTREHTVR